MAHTLINDVAIGLIIPRKVTAVELACCTLSRKPLANFESAMFMKCQFSYVRKTRSKSYFINNFATLGKQYFCDSETEQEMKHVDSGIIWLD